MMRYFEGYNQQLKDPPVWPADKTGCLPGPTLRVSVGEHVQIKLRNQTDVGAFPGGTLDAAETGKPPAATRRQMPRCPLRTKPGIPARAVTRSPIASMDRAPEYPFSRDPHLSRTARPTTCCVEVAASPRDRKSKAASRLILQK